MIGPAFSVRFPAELLARIDAAAGGQTSRADWLRRAAAEQLAYPRVEALAPLAGWLIAEGDADQVGYALEKPWKFQAEIYAAQHQIPGPDLDDLLEQRRRVSASAEDYVWLPPGWTVRYPTPVDVQIVCAHTLPVWDSQARRERRPPAECPRGCRATGDDTAQATPARLSLAAGRP